MGAWISRLNYFERGLVAESGRDRQAEIDVFVATQLFLKAVDPAGNPAGLKLVAFYEMYAPAAPRFKEQLTRAILAELGLPPLDIPSWETLDRTRRFLDASVPRPGVIDRVMRRPVDNLDLPREQLAPDATIPPEVRAALNFRDEVRPAREAIWRALHNLAGAKPSGFANITTDILFSLAVWVDEPIAS